ncbi:MAG: DUF5606 domain-containing protein [Bacteroidia bacterium]|jgi:hypothetical protein
MALYLSEIVSVAGKPGLQKLIGNRSNGLIVESLDGSGKRFPTTLSQKVSFLSDISMYTYDGDEKLDVILQKLHTAAEGGLELVTKKSNGADIQVFFRKVIENFDEDQVYNSDILKLVSWYKILKDKVNFAQLTEPEYTEEDKSAATKKKAAKKPTTKATPKSAPKAQSKAKGGVKKSGNLKAG